MAPRDLGRPGRDALLDRSISPFDPGDHLAEGSGKHAQLVVSTRGEPRFPLAPPGPGRQVGRGDLAGGIGELDNRARQPPGGPERGQAGDHDARGAGAPGDLLEPSRIAQGFIFRRMVTAVQPLATGHV